MTFTIKDLERLKQAGFIRNYTAVEVISNPKKPKFGNTKTVIDDIVFQSGREAKRYIHAYRSSKLPVTLDALLCSIGI